MSILFNNFLIIIADLAGGLIKTVYMFQIESISEALHGQDGASTTSLTVQLILS